MSKQPAKQEPANENHAPAMRERRRRSATVLAVAGLLVILGGGVSIWRLFFYRPHINKALQALQIVYRNERPLEARLGGFAYAQFTSLRGTPPPASEDGAHSLAEHLLFEAADNNQSPAARNALGVYYLTERQYDRAIDEFKMALQVDAQNAQIHSDLGAALFEKGRSGGADDEEGRSIEFLAQSLTHLNRALALDSNLHEALFNRALLRQQMMLTESAQEDWRSYIEKEPNSSWADEARQHLDRLEDRQREVELYRQNIVEDFLSAYRARDAARVWELFSPSRENLTTQLLAAYLKSASSLREDSGREALDALIYAGEMDALRDGDHYTMDLARFYKSASRRQLEAANKARELLNRSRELYMQSDLKPALELYAKAQRIQSQIGDTCEARMVTCQLGLINLEMARTEKSASLFASLARDCEADRYRWLRARALFYKSGVESNRNEYSKAIESARQAYAEALKVNDQPGAFSASCALIEYYRLLDNRGECFQQISLNLPLLEAHTFGAMSLGRHYGITAMTFNTFGYYDAAIDCQREALRFAAEIGDFASLSVAYTHLGLMFGKIENFTEAFKNIEMGYAQGEAHAGERVGQEKMAYAALQMGNLHRDTGDFDAALSSYNHSIEMYQSLNFPINLYQAYKGRLVCYTAQNDVAAARQQLADVMTLMDKNRENIFEEENRNNFFDVEQDVYDLGIDFEHSRMQEDQKAFDYAEASRGRSLLDSINAGAQVVNRDGKLDLLVQAVAHPLPLDEIQARIPDEARLLQYAVLGNKLLIWVVSRDGMKPVEVQVSQAALTDNVSSYLASLMRSSDEDRESATRQARELYRYLIEPVEPFLGGSHILFIVPDKALYRLPWDALISPASGEYAVENYLITLSPSATLFATRTELANQKAGALVERAMSVGNPSFDRLAFPKLDQLPDAEGEAKRIANIYSSRPLIGPAAREQAVRDELAKADVAHFALHCVINERSPMRSSLVLAKEPGGGADNSAMDGQLQAHEIYEIKLTRLRLAVLSACETGVERYYRGEGMIGMARAFLAAGVPMVVASLWPVDSKATAELMIRFHEYRKEGKPTPEALWLAKRDMLKDAVERYRQPFYWAAFESIGGNASF